MNGNTNDAPTEDATSTGSLIRRLASKNVHATSAQYTTTSDRTRRLTTRLRVSFPIPNSAKSMVLSRQGEVETPRESKGRRVSAFVLFVFRPTNPFLGRPLQKKAPRRGPP